MYSRKREQMTPGERRRGWVFFALYTLVFPWLVGLVRFALDSIWAFTLADAAANLIYNLAVTVGLILVFWTYLENAWRILLDFLPENLIALAVAAAGWLVSGAITARLPLPLPDTTAADYALEYSLAPVLTVVIYVFLMPLAEELLYRGLLFGTLKSRSRVAAYAVTAILFALGSVWQIAIAAGDPRYLWNALEYLPMALALCWCYDKGGSIFSPIVLHWVIHAATLYRAL